MKFLLTLALLLSLSEVAFAGTVPTPPPGTAVPVTVPSPNPLQYDAISGAVISSQQYNSNFWKSYNDINAIAGSLNTCAYSTGTGVTSVAATAPIMASVGACVPGTGTLLTLSLGAGVPYSATYYTASNTVADYRWPGSGSVAGDTMALDSAASTISGVSCDTYRFIDFTASVQLFCGDHLGNTGARTFNSSSHTIPYNLQAPPNDAVAHTEYDVLDSGTIAPTVCINTPWFFTTPFTAATTPYVSYSLSTGSPNLLVVSNAAGTPNNTGSTFILCNTATAGGAIPFTLYYFASGS